MRLTKTFAALCLAALTLPLAGAARKSQSPGVAPAGAKQVTVTLVRWPYT